MDAPTLASLDAHLFRIFLCRFVRNENLGPKKSTKPHFRVCFTADDYFGSWPAILQGSRCSLGPISKIIIS
jgi:hypothetical protein